MSSNSRAAGDHNPILSSAEHVRLTPSPTLSRQPYEPWRRMVRAVRMTGSGHHAGTADPDAPAPAPLPHQLPEPVPATGDVAAVFDLDGTILASNLVESYVWTRLAALPHRAWPTELLDLICNAPRYALAERRERAAFVHTFLRRYAGTDEQALARLVREAVGDALLHRVRPEAVRRIRAHRSAGHRTVLVTGSLDLLVRPLSPLFDDTVACHMGTRDGVMTGRTSSPPIVGEARGEWMRGYAADRGLDLKRCYAYADSYSDRALLETVGSPCAVNPDRRLLHHAARSQWPVVHWGTHTTSRWEALVAAAALPSKRRTGFTGTGATDTHKGTR
ncbi:HAD-IB family hydrolase [Streptomyces mirabilis]|uniref:HAD family hydrolase n=1 Tax=Streptomyces mirabilis TaxID=68239 RepID=UPI0021BF0D94|nr:HAD-IB family hydrolase [Streptomyces mirabilis]MCT9108933.1 HAD-IB family hydrolase [Streptomyces mirabilis]